MNLQDQELRRQAMERVETYQPLVNQDPYRLHYHIMPPVGLLNDPNGFIHWKGTYHLFYQWMPFKTGHGAKFWGHYSSADLVHWRHEEIALTPSDWYDQNGCYSGSAIDENGLLHVFYTGNVRDEEGNRETYQCLAVSKDGITFEKQGVVARLPEGYTAHFRDPKVWKKNGRWYMVLGAQTERLEGRAVLFSSENLTEWSFLGDITGSHTAQLDEFGYMWECPDMITLGGKDVLIVCPQGLEAEGFRFQNVYQSGYFVGELDERKPEFRHGEFEELDRGFDFYAPQTTQDESGRRILIAWMGVPDQGEQSHPTIPYEWVHCMTLPRELTLENNRLIQKPVQELRTLRQNGNSVQISLKQDAEMLDIVSPEKAEILLVPQYIEEGFEISFRGAARLIYRKAEGVLTLERQSYVDERTEARHCRIAGLKDLNIFLDASSVEIFVNGGEEVFTARYFPSPGNNHVWISGRKEIIMNVSSWTIA
ncbi:sucrose-6-phosphate hydrolase [Bacillus sonorensis]|uniref:sucrose-6-phosphate hydrolase n=1 Tax=Bacillus sonorensis TaxID=119858 RepID=UPI0022818F96|nr:sucrose-6-phosphate hydrolase [Bacillus sonorensis]MCY8023807.1 sucrose-6-phosphate hydrolase [Bacillus sonorensis]MCY8402754.1 sucrose-6-phosphate hydrolase [Bacillus sonorensis]MCZ0068319.1 sucrose-6-phosphate hydrolase [Bacillus sonorensis]MCZ0094714.1 sucrose-6-phosphate hydrolase [Bacillus sonorensis]MEC1354370.1 sucrose-6-phosphate hydrolase [Bacillus sonorensis]